MVHTNEDEKKVIMLAYFLHGTKEKKKENINNTSIGRDLNMLFFSCHSQDAALCRAVIERITVPMATGIGRWSQAAHSLLQRPRYDKLTAAAMETVLLVHWHYTLKPDLVS